MIPELKFSRKKGDIFQIFFMLVIVFGVAMVGLLCFALQGKISDFFRGSTDLNSSAVGTNVNNALSTDMPTVVDETVLFVFLGCMIGILIAAARTNFSPIVIFVFLLMLIMAIIMASGLVNIYNVFATSDQLSQYGSQLHLTNVILGRYTPLIICVLGGIVLILMYGKSGSQITP